MSDSLVILGRQPAIGLAELESLYGAANVEPMGDQAARLRLNPDQVDFSRLGGCIKLAEILDTLPASTWDAAETYLLKRLPPHIANFPEGKLTLGLSSYGLSASPARINATALSLKKSIRKSGRPVRIVPNQEPALNSAQVIHNHLVSPTGYEIVLVKAQGTIIIGRTLAEQNIASYTIRDRERPKRDPRVGMLPPKLAQIIINLASSTAPPATQKVVLDPFCGTGVVLQEALLMGFSAYGTDAESRMIDYTGENLDWLDTRFPMLSATCRFEQGDATSYQWQPPIDIVASETYLGRPFTSLPSPEVLAQTVSECNTILKKFLQNIQGQIAPSTRLCLAIPAWHIRPGQFKHLPLVDQIEDLGYNRVSFEHVRSGELLYYREDQIVARELLVVTRK